MPTLRLEGDVAVSLCQKGSLLHAKACMPKLLSFSKLECKEGHKTGAGGRGVAQISSLLSLHFGTERGFGVPRELPSAAFCG